MRTILAATALIMLIATPAFAQSKKADASKATRSYASDTLGMRAMNRAPAWEPAHSANPAYDVYVNGEYVGSDPDPRIRWTLREEWIGRWGDN